MDGHTVQREYNLPVPLDPLIGRGAEVASISSRLASARLLTITGAGGIGKTRIALEIGKTLQHEFPNGVWLADLSGCTDPSFVPQIVRATFHAATLAEEYDDTAIVNAIAPMHALLILDGCDWVIPPCAELAAQLLQTSPNLTILATSREPLRIPGEQVWRLPPLGVFAGNRDQPENTPSEAPAITLFMDVSAREAPHVAFSAADLGAVRDICRRLEGNPLAIKLASAQVRFLAPHQIATLLSASLDVLTGGSRTMPARHRSVRATIQWSFDLLHEDEQRLLCLLSVFVGGCTLEAVAAVAGAARAEGELLPLIASLVDKSLVVAEIPEVGTVRYRLPEVVRLFGQEQLPARNGLASVRPVHAAYFAELAQQTVFRRGTAEEWERLLALRADHENLLAALDWLTQTGDWVAAQRLCAALVWFWRFTGQYREGQLWIQRALAERPEHADREAIVRLQQGLGIIAWLKGDSGWARLMEDALQEQRTRPTSAFDLCYLLVNLGRAHAEAGRTEPAAALLQEASALADEMDSAALRAEVLHGLGFLAYRRGDAAQARQLAEQALSLATHQGFPITVTSSLNLLGAVCWSVGDFSTAHAHLELAVRQNRQWGLTGALALSLVVLGEVAIEQAEWATAQASLSEGLLLLKELGNQRLLASSLEGCTRLLAVQAQHIVALKLLGAASTLRDINGATRTAVAQTVVERYLARARRAVGKKQADAAFIEGKALREGDAIALALATLQQSSAFSPSSSEQSPSAKLPGALTAREREVAALVAQGLTNRAIAERLVISERTASIHVWHVLSKLGVPRRAMLAARAKDYGI